ncbi:MAG: hypothetical protein ACJ8FT_05495 [Sphingomonas sp.]
MTRLMITLAALAAMAGGLAALPTAAEAQAGQAPLDVYGNDPCPSNYICVRHQENERYRLPKEQQLRGTPQQRQSWARKSQVLTTVGNTGVGSCSAVGPGGRTGCLTQEIQQARQENQDQGDQPPK